MSEQPKSSRRRKKATPQLETEQQTYDCALNLLSFRDHSQRELRQKLLRRGAKDDQIKCSIDKLTDYGIMDEERYAQRVYEAWLAKRCYGRLHLQAELQKRGVPQQYIGLILEQFTDELEYARAEVAAKQFCKANSKKIEQGLNSEDLKLKQKLYGAAARYMAARGFGAGYMELVVANMHEKE